MSDNFEERMRAVVVGQLGVHPDQVNERASFMDDLGADSLDTVELIMAFEEELGVAIPEEDAEKLKTFGKAVEYLRNRRRCPVV